LNDNHPVPYTSNAAGHAAARDKEAALSKRIARLRLTTFLVAAAGLVWTLSRGVTPIPLAASLLMFAVFAGLVAWHSRVDARVAWFDALRLVNLRALSRRARDWHALPDADAPATVDLAEHPYAVDLDLFGRASLFQWLGPAATPRGRSTLAEWLLWPAPRTEILARQSAIAALAAEDDWRLRLEAHGVLAAGARQSEIDHFLAWAEGPPTFGRHDGALRAAVYGTVAVLWILIALHATGIISAALWPIPLIVGIILSFATAERIQSAFDRAGGGQDALGRYAAIFEHAVSASRAAPRLTELLERLSADGQTAPGSMRRLNRILGCAELRRGAALLHFPVQAFTLWDFHVLFALERWRVSSGRRVRVWLDALAELEALTQLATAHRDNPEWAAPEFGSAREVVAEDIGHPLIPDGRRVANSVTMGPPGSVLLITGSNMSGKSTLLRSIGLNIVLAHAGACVCARSLSLPDCDLQTSIRVTDSLERGLSYFMAALARLKGVVDAAQHERKERVLVYLLDEILQGTNSVERSLAVRAVTRRLLDAGAVGAMTTHDLALADEEPMKSAAQLMHFSETLDPDGTMRFDYVLKPGLATSRNALRLMQMIGIDL
jgi:hypothetical protein